MIEIQVITIVGEAIACFALGYLIGKTQRARQEWVEPGEPKGLDDAD